MLVQCTCAAARKKDSYYKAQFNRLRAKSGPKQAICVVAASILTAIYHMLKNGTEHRDLGASYFDRQPIAVTANRLVRKFEKLGYHAELKPIQTAARVVIIQQQALVSV
jgi:transposase